MSKSMSSIQQLSMIAIAFFLPFHMTFVYPFFFIVIFCEIFNSDFIKRQKTMFSSPLVICFILFFLLHSLGLIWSKDTIEGLDTINRYIPFFLFGFLWLAAKYENRDFYMISFIFGLCLCAALAHYNLLQKIYPNYLIEGITSGKRNGDETSPFLSHLTYSPILAIGIYFIAWAILKVRLSFKKLGIYLTGLLFLLSNLIFSTGRAGFLMLIVLFCSLIISSSKNLRMGFIKLLLIIPICIASSYYLSENIKDRVDAGLNDIQTFSENPNSSIGLRVVFAIHSFDLFLENPFFGVGTGSLRSEYESVVRPEFVSLVIPNNPHNQYLMVASSLGIFGLISLFLIFLLSYRYSDSRGRALVIGFLAICLVESYLWRANTSFVFVYFISVFSQRQSFLFSSTIK